ncbi:MAG: RagB/SusD family nutrient uptake outer membrane protein [Bacteroidia bacterium]|nr:RagB/SusD family nutrient uptake outer membrane protein [Bacteroidia bacterium]
MIKRITYGLLIGLSLISCEGDLFQDPLTAKSINNFFSNEGEIESAINGVYATLQSTGLYNLYLPAIGEIPSDNTFDEVPANDGGRYGQLDEFTTISSNDVITTTWKDAYIGIQAANLILNRIGNIDFETDSIKEARIGELKFIRALLYFNLVRIYGDVPLVTQETTDPTTYFGQARTPVEEVYLQLVMDLEDALELLPLSPDQPGRVNLTAAQTLLGKVFLTLKDFDKAEMMLQAVVDAGIHSLQNLPEEVFDVNNELNSEIIFAVQFASGVNGNSEGSDAFVQFSPSGTVNGAKGHNLPNRDFIALYNQNDLRKSAYIGETDKEVPFCKKYHKPLTIPEDGESDWVVLRYAEVLLMLAESKNENGNISEALFYLNLVRNRAGLENYTSNDQSEVDKAIELERRLELIGEGHRWFYLLRTGKAIETVNQWFEKNTSLGISIEEHDLLMPIPQSQINTDPALKQNPGY